MMGFARAYPACAVTLVMVLGLFGMFTLPIASEWIGLASSETTWCGVALREVAQAVAASWQVGPEGASGTLAKLMRVMLLVPALFVVIFFRRGSGGQMFRLRCHGLLSPLPGFAVCAVSAFSRTL